MYDRESLSQYIGHYIIGSC